MRMQQDASAPLSDIKNSLTNKNTVFRRTAPETKADSVTRIVKGMIDADTSAREAKTLRLRVTCPIS